MTVTNIGETGHSFLINTVDIVDNKVAGVGIVGASVYDVDTKTTYVVKPDLTLSSLALYSVGITGAIPAGEAHLGSTGGNTTLTPITFSLDTAQYSDGDVLADTQVLAACLRVNNGTGVIQDVQFNDEDDQGQPFDVIIFNANTSLGSENSAPNISDANARTIVGRFQVTASDWYDLGGVRIANIKNVGIAVKGATGSDDIYIGLISRGTGTYTASGITAILKILCD